MLRLARSMAGFSAPGLHVRTPSLSKLLKMKKAPRTFQYGPNQGHTSRSADGENFPGIELRPGLPEPLEKVLGKLSGAQDVPKVKVAFGLSVGQEGLLKGLAKNFDFSAIVFPFEVGEKLACAMFMLEEPK